MPEYALGVIFVNDMFDVLRQYRTVKPQLSNCHYCVECYTRLVVEAADRLSPRKKDVKLYQEKVRELTYAFKHNLFYNFRHKHGENPIGLQD